MDSNEGLRANLYLFKNIRAVYPFSDKRIADTFFGLSAEVRYDVLSRVGWSVAVESTVSRRRHDQR
jgi:hypothetical protein